jgi:hypothetical protein
VGDTAVEESEWGREGLADGFRIGAEGLDLVSSCVVDGGELRHAFQDGLVGLGSGAEDSREMAPVFDEVDVDSVTTIGGAGERVEVEEDAVADSCRGAGGAVRNSTVSSDSPRPCVASTRRLQGSWWSIPVDTGCYETERIWPLLSAQYAEQGPQWTCL